MRTLQHGEGGFQPDSGRGGGILQKVVQSVQREGGQLAQTVFHFGGVISLSGVDSRFECGLGAKPIVNCSAMNAGLFGCGGDGLPMGEGGDDLGLSRRQVGI